MDAEQEFFDLLFEEPDTIKGLKNKADWLYVEFIKAAEGSKHYLLITNIILENYRELRRRIDRRNLC